MAPTTIVTCFPLTDDHVARIAAADGNVEVIVSEQTRIANDIFDADVFCGHAKVPMPWEDVIAAGRLKWIQSTAAGLDHCAPAVADPSILVSGCSGLFADQVAEQAVALLLAGVRRLPDFFRGQSDQTWERLPTDVLHGKTVSIVGFGGNGRGIARLLQPIAGRIIATDLFPEFEPPDFVQVLPADRLEQLFTMGDVVIVTIPLTPETRQIIGSDLFSLMKDGAYFVNVARGAVVDHAALLDALDSGKIAFAGLDVTDPEPLPPESPLWSHERVLITPHVGAQSPNRVEATVDLFCQNLHRWRAREPLINQVDTGLPVPHPRLRFRPTNGY